MARPSTEEQHAAYSPPQKRSAMAELFGEVFKTQEQEKPFEAIIEEEVSTYRSAPSIHVDANPFIWWKTNEAKFPHVAELARRHLCVPGTSVASERIFSTAGDIVDANRSRLGADNVDKLIFLQKNMKIHLDILRKRHACPKTRLRSWFAKPRQCAASCRTAVPVVKVCVDPVCLVKDI
ncbi:hypothetical protein WMY93_006021 [Mugilogobius chulae]|uniref:HAT C-terminal dimerisation domain-containing protein n=1 Tax=Mugilogobius chulae TaxID=88201 RepID=A0AAW0PMR9_9GOBI